MQPSNFHILQIAEATPQKWLQAWSKRYGLDDDEEHSELIARYQSLSTEDFVRIGKWKDGVLPNQDGKWKANVASVAYLIWMQAASTRPTCPPETEIANFLTEWSERTYSDTFSQWSYGDQTFWPTKGKYIAPLYERREISNSRLACQGSNCLPVSIQSRRFGELVHLRRFCRCSPVLPKSATRKQTSAGWIKRSSPLEPMSHRTR